MREIVDLGRVPSIHLLRRDQGEVPTLPVHVFLCEHCGLVQMPVESSTSALYEGAKQYITSHQGTSYIRDLVDTLSTFRSAQKGLEIGCNDGGFLAALQAAGFGPLIGVEPNAQTAAMASNRGFRIEQGYFGMEAAEAILATHGQFDFVVARHVLEHVDRIGDFMAGVERLLGPDGLFLLELPHVEPGFAAGAVNVLWEEHINYFFEPVIDDLLRNHGFRPVVRRHYTGGALVSAVIASRTERPAQAAWTAGKSVTPYLAKYADRVASYRKALRQVLEAATGLGCTKAVYGAGFRTSTTVNAMGIGSVIDLVIDDRPDLAGYFLPGTKKAIQPLDGLQVAGPLLLLLGVGAEYERRVLQKARTRFAGPVIPLSLVYPGEPLAHCEGARRELMALANPGR